MSAFSQTSRTTKLALTDDQKIMYRSEKLMNFRWIASVLSTYAPYTLTSGDLVTPAVQQYISDIGQFAEIVYALQTELPAKFLFDNLNALLEPTMPLEGYNYIRDTVLITSFVGSAANLPGYIAYRSESKQLVLATAGTSSATQAIYDLRALMHRHKSKHGYVHTGFWQLYKGMKHLALEGVRNGIAQHDVQELVITGHSMGAAVSQLFLLELLRDDSLLPLQEIRIRYVGFGGPRSGTKDLVQYWQELIKQWRQKHGDDSIEEYSVKMYNDGVPSLPPMSFGYRHYCQRPYYFLHGRLYHVPDGYSEYSLFHATSDEEDEKPPIHPRGGHNYYNGRDMERFARRAGWLDRVLKKEGDWRELYRAKVAKHEANTSSHLSTNAWPSPMQLDLQASPDWGSSSNRASHNGESPP
ncbi:Triacylglycerol lipase [Mycena indigotica]|uniref:Triacylglycerol lipase n=1 Tax=Mycena indigotica TaxID=2126181 RepID=A0A8H6W666_9AGAR|nr:Triacylglycerol lipase [Mycena indigotica]KAF7306377.1 Triacylglycerol lipase [Mycena indigotica]